jgi:hypothetical protein
MLGILLTTLWRYFPVFSSVFGLIDYSNIGFSGMYKEFYQGQYVFCIIPSLIGLLYLKKSLDDKRGLLFALSLGVFALIYNLNFITVQSGVFGRLIVYIAFSMQILSLLFIFSDQRFIEPKKLRKYFLVFLIVLAIPQILMAFKSLSFMKDFNNYKPIGYYSNFSYAQRLKPICDLLPTNKLLLAPKDESWVIPALTGVKVIAIKHTDPFLKDFALNNSENERFFDIDDEQFERKTFLNKHKPDFILLRTEGGLLEKYGVEKIAEEIYKDSSYVLLKIEKK